MKNIILSLGFLLHVPFSFATCSLEFFGGVKKVVIKSNDLDEVRITENSREIWDDSEFEVHTNPDVNYIHFLLIECKFFDFLKKNKKEEEKK